MGATTMVETFTQGTIVADLFDGQTKKVVWRASAAIAKMFEHYPPAGS